MRRVNMSILVASVLSLIGWEDVTATLPKRKTSNRVSGNHVKATKGKRHASQRSRSNRRK